MIFLSFHILVSRISAFVHWRPVIEKWHDSKTSSINNNIIPAILSKKTKQFKLVLCYSIHLKSLCDVMGTVPSSGLSSPGKAHLFCFLARDSI